MSLALLALAALVGQDYRLPLELGGPNSAPYVTAYRDHSGSGNGLRDWNCGNDTYDGHRGTDIGIGGFAAMDRGSRWVVAAADGEVTTVVDGCFDRCTSGGCNCGGGFGNYVRITHADGKSTYYGHLMNGSVQVRRNQRVTCGTRLGRVGSSGNSTGPHLHFEPRYSNGTSDDPFAGRCGGPLSYWVQQGAYQRLPAEMCEGAPPPPPPPPPPPATGRVRGSVFDRSVTAGPSDPGNKKLPGATVVVMGGPTVTARAGDAIFDLRLAPGNYTIEARHAGYRASSRMIAVTAGQDGWASIGLEPEAQRPVVTPDAGVAPVEPEPPPPEPSPDASAGAPEPPLPSTDAGTTAGAGDAPRMLEEVDGGCRCVAPGASPAPWALLLPLAILLRTRRRRSR